MFLVGGNPITCHLTLRDRKDRFSLHRPSGEGGLPSASFTRASQAVDEYWFGPQFANVVPEDPEFGYRTYDVDPVPELGGIGTNSVDTGTAEPYSSTAWDARVKDALEGRLHQMVYEGKIDLSIAQVRWQVIGFRLQEHFSHRQVAVDSSNPPPSTRRRAGQSELVALHKPLPTSVNYFTAHTFFSKGPNNFRVSTLKHVENLEEHIQRLLASHI